MRLPARGDSFVLENQTERSNAPDNGAIVSMSELCGMPRALALQRQQDWTNDRDWTTPSSSAAATDQATGSCKGRFAQKEKSDCRTNIWLDQTGVWVSSVDVSRI